MISYITYKIINQALFFFVNKSYQKPMISLVGVRPTGVNQIHFDFSHSSSHLGDRLFFFPLIVHLVLDGCRVSLSSKDLQTNEMMTTLYGLPPLPVGDSKSADLVVVPKPSYLSKRRGCKNLVVIDFTDTRIKLGVSKWLMQSFYRFLGLSLSNLDRPVARAVSCQLFMPQLQDGHRYFLFSNYINSGVFRKWFLNETLLFNKCLDLKRQGYRIVHVGSREDRLSDSRAYPFVDVDLRGDLSLSQMLALSGDPRIVGAVTYDNFLMHLMGIFQKDAYVLFRGRFFKKNREHHFRFVNNTFFDDPKRLNYLAENIFVRN